MAKKEQDALQLAMEGWEQEFAYYTGAPLLGMNFTAGEGGWLLVIKTNSVQRGRLVAFFGGKTPADCLEGLLTAMNTMPGISWRPDKYLNGK